MTAETEDLERELVADLGMLDERLADERFSSDLYRGLASRMWRKDGGPDGHVSLSWGRAEEIVNELRRRGAHDPLTLAQTGGEGEVSGAVEEELDRLGWHSTPLNPERHDPAHVARPDSPPPSGQGEAESPTEDSHAWERQAHREAEESRGRAGPGEGG